MKIQSSLILGMTTSTILVTSVGLFVLTSAISVNCHNGSVITRKSSWTSVCRPGIAWWSPLWDGNRADCSRWCVVGKDWFDGTKMLVNCMEGIVLRKDHSRLKIVGMETFADVQSAGFMERTQLVLGASLMEQADFHKGENK